MTERYPAIGRALVVCGVEGMLADAGTSVGGYGDPWSLLGTGRGALVAGGALRLMARAAAMHARIKKERELRRIVLAFGTHAGLSRAVVFVLAIARWRLDTVTTQVLWTTGSWASANPYKVRPVSTVTGPTGEANPRDR